MAPIFTRWNWLKTAARASLALAGAALLLSFAVDLWAKRRLPYFESAFSAAMQRPVEIGAAGFDPIRGFYFSDFSVREKSTAPVPLFIRRIEARTALVLWPEPALRVARLTFVEPRIGVDVHPEDLFRSHLWLRRLPALETRIGGLKLEAKLDSVEVRRGRVALFSPTGLRRDFEQVRFFAGKKWFGPQQILFEGQAGADPDARFKIDCRIRPDGAGGSRSDVRAEFHRFTSAYLEPVLAGRFRLPEKNLTGSVWVSVGKEGVDVRGRLALPEPAAPALWRFWQRHPQMRFSLSGRRQLDQVVFDEFTIRAANVLLLGNAAVVWKKGRESYRVALASKNIPIDRLPEEWARPWRFEAGTVDCRARLYGDARHFESDARFSLTDVSAHNRPANVKIDRATGTIHLTRERIESRNVWLFWNNTPLRASGFLALGTNGRLALEGQTYPGQLRSLKDLHPLNAQFRLTAKRAGEAWSGALKLDLERGAGRGLNWIVSFRELGIRRFEKGRARVDIRRLLVRAERPVGAGSPAPLRVGPVRVRADISPAKIELRVPDGFLEKGRFAGHFSWDNARRIRGWFRLRGADASELSRRLNASRPASGILDAGLRIGGSPERPETSGHYRITRGAIGPDESLRRLSEQIGIESLDPLQFDRLFGRFRLKDGTLDLEKWKLTGPAIDLSADARVRDGALTGRLTARFPLRAVRSSSSLAWLAKFVGESEAVDFDFRIAGRPEQPRVHWLAGDFRNKIRKRLAPWMQAELSRQIQKRFVEKAPGAATA